MLFYVLKFVAMLADVALGMLVGWSIYHLSPDWNTSATVGRIAMRFSTDMKNNRVPQMMNPNDLADRLTFH